MPYLFWSFRLSLYYSLWKFLFYMSLQIFFYPSIPLYNTTVHLSYLHECSSIPTYFVTYNTHIQVLFLYLAFSLNCLCLSKVPVEVLLASHPGKGDNAEEVSHQAQTSNSHLHQIQYKISLLNDTFKGTGSVGGLRYCWRVWLDLSLNKRRQWVYNFLGAPLICYWI